MEEQSETSGSGMFNVEGETAELEMIISAGQLKLYATSSSRKRKK